MLNNLSIVGMFTLKVTSYASFLQNVSLKLNRLLIFVSIFSDDPPPFEHVTNTHIANIDFKSNHVIELQGFTVSARLRGTVPNSYMFKYRKDSK